MNLLADWVECLSMARETKVLSQVESYRRLKKWYLIPPCLTLSIIRLGSRVKWSNQGKGVVLSPLLLLYFFINTYATNIGILYIGLPCTAQRPLN